MVAAMRRACSNHALSARSRKRAGARLNGAASKADGPQGHGSSNLPASAKSFLSVAQLGARLLREQKVACSIHARETPVKCPRSSVWKSTGLRSRVVGSSSLSEGAIFVHADQLAAAAAACSSSEQPQ